MDLTLDVGVASETVMPITSHIYFLGLIVPFKELSISQLIKKTKFLAPVNARCKHLRVCW